ncbi:hypothetical protein [Candidatus Villigracilis affinis]|uniref:hypothetical protein n=1 Tax=Candidatus Villigracilis affinis TaxID=3140682 RepID=UPI002A1DD796|nr:hypothetical protein [Anaerolineales bacterium]
MKNKLSFDIRIVAIVFFVCFLALSAILGRISSNGEKLPEEPKVTLQNISPCLEPDWKRVEKLTEGEPQWICADMKTDWLSIDLGLKIFHSEDGKYVYSDYSEVSSGLITFIIYPPLPPGKYGARITGFRGPTYVNFEFEVVKKGNE